MSTPPGAPEEPSEQELRAAYEAELSRISSADVILQAAVSLLNIGGMRLGLASAPGAGTEPDLEQVRDAIDGVRALLPILERKAPEEIRPLRDALSQLQMAFARQTGGAQPSAGATSSTGPGAAPGQSGAPNQPGAPAQPGAQPPVPGSSAPPASGQPSPATQEPASDPAAGPAVSSGRLWVPGR